MATMLLKDCSLECNAHILIESSLPPPTQLWYGLLYYCHLEPSEESYVSSIATHPGGFRRRERAFGEDINIPVSHKIFPHFPR